MENPEKLATQGTQDQEKHNTIQCEKRRRIRTLSLQLWAIAVMLVKTFPKNVSSVWFLGAYDTSSAGKE
jgi:hypothetical protein